MTLRLRTTWAARCFASLLAATLFAAPALATDSTWQFISGKWSNATAWTNGIPGAMDDVARLIKGSSDPTTVTIDVADLTLGQLHLVVTYDYSDPEYYYPYTVAGQGLGMAASSGPALIRSSGDYYYTHTIGAPVILYSSTQVDVLDGGLLISGRVSGGMPGIGLTLTGWGTLSLTGANTYTGVTTVEGGILDAIDGVGLPAASPLVLQGDGVLLASGAFTRPLGTGAGQVRWLGSGGIAAKGGNALIALGGTACPTALTWGSADFNPGRLTLGACDDGPGDVEFRNSVDLGGQVRTVAAQGDYYYSGNVVRMTGVLSNGGLTQAGDGTLALDAANTYAGPTTIAGGTLRAVDGVGLPAASPLHIDGGVWEASGCITRSVGAGPGQIQFDGSGGFAARGGKLTVALGGTASPAPLVWGSGGGMPPSYWGDLVLGSSNADSETEIVNPIDFGGAMQWIYVNDNFDSPDDRATLSGTLSNGALYKYGSGTLVLSGDNTLEHIYISSGVLRGAPGRGIPSSAVVVLGGGMLEGEGPCTFTHALGTGPGTVSWSGWGGGGLAAHGGKMTVALGGTAAPTPLTWGEPNFVADGYPLVLNSTTADSEVDFRNAINLAGDRTVEVTGNALVHTDFARLSGVLSNGSLTKTGAARLVLSGNNTYTGPTTISNGTLWARDGEGLPHASPLVLDGGIFVSTGLLTRPLGSTAGRIRWAYSGGFAALGGKLTVALGGTAAPATLAWGQSGFVPSGRSLVLNAANSDSEVELVNSLNLNQSTRTVYVNDNVKSDADGAVLSGAVLSGSASSYGSGELVKQGRGRLVLAGNCSSLRELTVEEGTLILRGANNYNNYVTVGGGVFEAALGTSLSNTSELTLAGGVFQSDGGGTVARSLGGSPNRVCWTAGGGFAARNGRLTVAIGGTAAPTVLTWGATYCVAAGEPLVFGSATADSEVLFRNSILLGNQARTVHVDDNPHSTGDFVTLAGSLSGSGAGLTKTGNGVLVLGATNSYTGPTAVLGGTLRLNVASALPAVSALTVGDGAVLDMKSYSLNLPGVVLDGGTLDGAGWFTSNNYDLRDGTVNVTLMGGNGLTKSTSGTVTLRGGYLYSGTTRVNGGTLRLAGSGPLASSTIDVAQTATFDVSGLTSYALALGQTLKGGGTVLGNVLVRGRTSPGSSAGVLTVGDITYADGSMLEIELGGTARGTQYDVLDADGAVTLQTGSRLRVLFLGAFTPADGDTFDVLDFASLTGTFTTLNLPALDPGLTWDTGRLYADGVLEVVPEPATLALVALGALAVIRRRRGR